MNRLSRASVPALLAGVLCTLTPAGSAHADATPSKPTARSVAVSNVNELVVRYLAAWNEKDAKHRRELIAQTWREDGAYIDAHRHGSGHESIDAMIAAAQQQFPDYRLRLASGIETHNNYVRFSWAAGGGEQAPLYIGGTDFAVIGADGRFQSVTGFIDAAPAAVK